jgi:hypothetical protein
LVFSTPANFLPTAFPPATLILVVLISCIVMAFGIFSRDHRSSSEPHL